MKDYLFIGHHMVSHIAEKIWMCKILNWKKPFSLKGANFYQSIYPRQYRRWDNKSIAKHYKTTVHSKSLHLRFQKQTFQKIKYLGDSKFKFSYLNDK